MAALADGLPLARKINLRLRDLRHQPVVAFAGTSGQSLLLYIALSQKTEDSG
jgi:hypothetical protein